MAARVTVTECPNCGAPVDPADYRDSTDPKCRFCEHALPVVDDAAPAVPPTVSTSTASPAWAATEGSAPGRSRAGPRVALAVLVLVVIAFGVGLALLIPAVSKSTKTSQRPRLAGAPAPVPGAGSDDVLVATESSGQVSTLTIERLNMASGARVWSGPTFTGQSDATIVVAAPVFAVVAGDVIVGVDLASGQKKWQQTLSNDLQSSCTVSCTGVAGGFVGVLSKDGNVQSFELATGRPAWTKRLASTPRYLESTGTNLVADEDAGGDNGHQLDVFDPASGKERQIRPACPLGGDSQDVARPDSDEDWYIVPGGQEVVALMSDISGCIAGVNLSSGATLWMHPDGEDNTPVPFTWTGKAQARQGGLLWTTDANGGNQLWTVEPKSGNVTRLTDAAGYVITPIGMAGGVAIAEAAPSFDSEKPEIWAFDVAGGRLLWKQASRVKGTIDKQGVALTSTGVVVVSCEGTNGGFTKPCYYEALDLHTGATTGTSSTKQDLIPEINDLVPVGDELLVRHSGQLVAVDPKTAAVRATFGQP